MSQHPNARLTPRGRETLVSRVAGGEGVSSVARQMGVSRQTASKWLARARRGEPMTDRPSRPRRLARLTPPGDEERVLEARRSMLLAPLALAAETGVPARTCARIVARSGLPRLSDVDRVTGGVRRRGPATPVRYERGRPGELVHVDVKRVARVPDGGGWRADPSAAPRGSGAGWGCLHVAVDDHGRAAYVELLDDERGATCSAFMSRCLSFFAATGVRVEGVMTDNGGGYRFREFNAPPAHVPRRRRKQRHGTQHLELGHTNRDLTGRRGQAPVVVAGAARLALGGPLVALGVDEVAGLFLE